jgi:hypothetical protein
VEPPTGYPVASEAPWVTRFWQTQKPVIRIPPRGGRGGIMMRIRTVLVVSAGVYYRVLIEGLEDDTEVDLAQDEHDNWKLGYVQTPDENWTV